MKKTFFVVIGICFLVIAVHYVRFITRPLPEDHSDRLSQSEVVNQSNNAHSSAKAAVAKTKGNNQPTSLVINVKFK